MRTKDIVRELLADGLSQGQIAARLSLSKSTIAYHARTLGKPADTRCNRRYDWAAVQHFYDAGHSVRECQAAFGFASQTWHAAMRRGAIQTRPRAMSIQQLLAGPRNRSHIKERLLQAGLKDAACEVCGVVTWQGAPLSLELHHINGDGADNRLENLQLLCPNCHSQTGNYGARNRGVRRGTSLPAAAALRGSSAGVADGLTGHSAPGGLGRIS